jgi:DNA invertase Pin-like site-specific DNA recombinase
VYVRQSTRQQVADHGESTRLQYGLVERAVTLGWPASRVMVIDEDLGKSGSSAAGRAGFQRLVTEITLGHVGLVLGIEMSRLARSGADWYQLLELCALSGALLADADGVYDPVDYNDRLLLGLKGTMSEAELHLLKQRMLAGKQAKARRGELAIALPTGYVRRPSGEAALDPDEQVQTIVRLIFAKFAELGTLHGVLRWLVDHDVELGIRLRCGPDKGELCWRRPNRMTLQNILHSPVYAGIYAYGRPGSTLAGSCRAGPAPAGSCGLPTSGWWRSRGCCPPTSPSSSIRPTWPGWPPTPPGPRPPAWCAPGRRCCRGWRAADVAAGG